MSGSQYTAYEHINILKDNNISISMDAKGRSIDNIVIERFWRSLKYENVYPSGYENIKEARLGIGDYIDTYNKKDYIQLLIIILLMKFIVKQLIMRILLVIKSC